MIDDNELNKMFNLSGIDKTKLHESLCKLGAPKKRCKDIWTPERPTTGYCYVVTEVLSYDMKKRGVPHKTFRLDLGGGESHWFIRLGTEGDDEIIDLTADQIDDRYSYKKAKPRGLQKNQHMRYGMSDQAEELARKMKLL